MQSDSEEEEEEYFSLSFSPALKRSVLEDKKTLISMDWTLSGKIVTYLIIDAMPVILVTSNFLNIGYDAFSEFHLA